MTFGKLPLALGIRLCSLWLVILAFAVVLLIPAATAYVMLALMLYYLLFGFAFDRFLFSAYANAVCERYINPNIEGAKTGMGLRQTTEDDYEIDPTRSRMTNRNDVRRICAGVRLPDGRCGLRRMDGALP